LQRELAPQTRFQSIRKFEDPASVFGAYREDMLETEPREFCIKKLMFRVVNFINRDQNRFSGLTQFFSQHFVDRRYAGGAVSNENDRVRHLHGELGFGLNLIVKRIAQG